MLDLQLGTNTDLGFLLISSLSSNSEQDLKEFAIKYSW